MVACLVERESRGDPYAEGAAGERGLLQVHPVTWPYLAQHGITPDMLFDPPTNLRAGYLLYLEAGSLRPWTTRGGCA
jgi:soluble lytic murein transglycosylase-like protein